MINVTNGKVLRLLVDDEPFDLRYGTVEHHDAHAGPARRRPAPRGALALAGRSGRDPAHDAPGLLRPARDRGDPLRGRALSAAPARIVVQSELVANEPVPETTNDPRAAAALRKPLQAECARPPRAARRPRAHHARLAAARRGRDGPRRRGPDETVTGAESEKDLARVTFATDLEPGETLRIVKFIAYGWSSRRSLPALRDQVDAALAAAMHTGWDGPRRVAARRTSTTSGRGADVELDGDPALQQAMRFALFSVLQAAARAEGRAIPAKGLTGRGYDGHSLLGHGDLHAAAADLRRAGRRRATRCCGATRRSRSRRRAPAS